MRYHIVLVTIIRVFPLHKKRTLLLPLIGEFEQDLGRVILLMRMFASFSSRDKKALANLDEEDTKFQFNLKGERPFYLIANNTKVQFQLGTAESPEATFTTDVATFYKIFSGEISQDEAFVNRKIEVSGSMLASARFRRLANMMLASHKTSLKFLRFFIRIVPL